MSEIVKPTCDELCEEVGFEKVDRETDDSWRHGVRVTEVYKRESDGTFWQVKYRLSTDGECNELREGIAKIAQVIPTEVVITKYVTFEPMLEVSHE